MAVLEDLFLNEAIGTQEHERIPARSAAKGCLSTAGDDGARRAALNILTPPHPDARRVQQLHQKTSSAEHAAGTHKADATKQVVCGVSSKPRGVFSPTSVSRGAIISSPATTSDGGVAPSRKRYRVTQKMTPARRAENESAAEARGNAKVQRGLGDSAHASMSTTSGGSACATHEGSSVESVKAVPERSSSQSLRMQEPGAHVDEALMPPGAERIGSAVVERLQEHLCGDPDFDVACVIGYDGDSIAVEDSTCCGLRNLGNTCYGNALINALARLPLCRQWLARHQEIARGLGSEHPRVCLLCDLAEDIAALTTLTENEAFRSRFIERRAAWTDGHMFNNFEQHDANDAFFKMMHACNAVDLRAAQRLEVGSDLLSDSRTAYTTPFWKMFGSRVCDKMRCDGCGKVTLNNAYRCAFTAAVPTTGVHLLEDLFMAQVGIERLGTEQAPDICELDAAAPERSGCGARNKRTKMVTINEGAPILVLQLLRFAWDHELQCAKKLTTRVDFEVVFPPMLGNAPLDLRAVIVHEGARPNTGHYVAYVRAQDGLWHLCDDESLAIEASSKIHQVFYQTNSENGVRGAELPWPALETPGYR